MVIEYIYILFEFCGIQTNDMEQHKELARKWMENSSAGEIVDIIAENGKVVVRTATAVFIHQIMDGKITETWQGTMVPHQENVFEMTMKILKDMRN